MGKSREYKWARREGYPGHSTLRLNKDTVKRVIKMHLLVWVLILGVLFSGYYDSFLVTMDIAIIALFLLHAAIVSRLMKNGAIPAYYRKEYRTEGMQKFAYWKHIVVFGAFVRIGFLTFMLGVVYSDNGSGLRDEWIRRTENMAGIYVGLLVYVIFLIVMYYQDRFVHIDKFTRRVEDLLIEKNIDVNLAANIVHSNLKREESLASQRPAPRRVPVNVGVAVVSQGNSTQPEKLEPKSSNVKHFKQPKVEVPPAKKKKKSEALEPEQIVPRRRRARRDKIE